MQVEVDTKCMQTNFGGRGYADFGDIGPFCFLSDLYYILYTACTVCVCVQLLVTCFAFPVVSVESTGALSADTLVLEAIRVMIGKCNHFLSELDRINE